MAEIGSFRNLEGGLSRVHVRGGEGEAGGSEVKGQSSWNVFGRMASRLSEWFGAGKQNNIAAGRELVGAVRGAYGESAASAVETHLQSKALSGKPLSSRRVAICLQLAEKFAVAKEIPGVSPRIVQALQDPGKPHLNAIRRAIADNQAALPRAANSNAMLGQFQQCANRVVADQAAALAERCGAFPAIAGAKGWEDFVLQSPTTEPIGDTLSRFLGMHEKDQPPLLDANTRGALLAETGPIPAVLTYVNKAQGLDHAPGGAAFQPLLDEVSREVFGEGFDSSQIPLRGLTDKMLDRVLDRARELARGPNPSLEPLTADQVRELSRQVVRDRCEHFAHVQREVAAADLDQPTLTMMADIVAGGPDSSFERMIGVAQYARHLNECAQALASGDMASGLESFFKGYETLDPTDALAVVGLRAAVNRLTPDQRLAALNTIRSSDLMSELYLLSGCKGLMIDLDDNPELVKTLMTLDYMASDVDIFKGELAHGAGLNITLIEAELQVNGSSIDLYWLSPSARDFAERYVAARTEFASSRGEPPPPELDLDGLAGLKTPDYDPSGPIRRAYQELARHQDFVAPVFAEAFVVQAPVLAGSDVRIPPAAVALSGRNRLEEIRTETLKDFSKDRSIVGGDMSFAEASNDPGLQQFMIDSITNERSFGLSGSNGEMLFKGVEPGEARWVKWQNEVGKHFADDSSLGNAMAELSRLCNQRVLGDLVSLNAPAHGFAPALMDQGGFKLDILGVDREGYLGLKFEWTTDIKALFHGNPPRVVKELDGTYEMTAMMRYRPSAVPGETGELLIDRHVARYQLEPQG